ncbi:MAG: quinolinate synthase NadA [Oscillospiraceae bacterium]|nr:quinolinate synthase NadA [Oscillospiraceae bacterium]
MEKLNELQKKILDLKSKKNAVILAHFYQTMDIQIIADYAGDSFELSKRAKNAEENLIVFCGVKFMAESAKLLSPHKKVLLPNPNAGCPMADMVNPEIIRNLRKEHPNAAVVCYVNSSAETKAECDICCTSSNAVNIVRKIGADEIIFVPDKNLGAYVAQFVPEKKFIYINGFCPIHRHITVDDTIAKKREFPNATFAVHPECEPDVVKLADFIGSTSQILNYCIESNDKEFIIGTEYGVVERLRFYHPEKKYYILTPTLVCPNMKKTTLNDIYNCLSNEADENVIELSDDIINKANIPLEKMLLLG